MKIVQIDPTVNPKNQKTIKNDIVPQSVKQNERIFLFPILQLHNHTNQKFIENRENSWKRIRSDLDDLI